MRHIDTRTISRYRAQLRKVIGIRSNGRLQFSRYLDVVSLPANVNRHTLPEYGDVLAIGIERYRVVAVYSVKEAC